MAIVGTAYVEVRAVTDKVRGQVQEGFQRGMSGVGTDAAEQFEQEMLPGMDHAADEASTRLRKKFTKAGDVSGGSFLDRFQLRLWNGMESMSNRFNGLWGAAGNDSGNRFGQKFWEGAQKSFKKVSFKPLLFGGLAAFIPSLVALVGQLGGGLVALSSSIGQAAGSIGPLYSSLVPLLSVMGGVKLGLSGVGDALKVLNNPDATPEATAEALKKLTPAARGFAQTLHGLQPEIKKLRETAGRNLFPGLTDGLKSASTLLPSFRRMIGQIDKAVGQAARSTGRWLAGPEGMTLMNGIFRRNVISVRNLTGAFTPFIRSLLRIYSAMQPVQNQLTLMIKHGTQWLDLWTRSHQSTMESYFQRSFNRLKQVGRILGDLIKVVLNVGHAASHAGNTMLDSIERVTGGWVKLTGKISTQNKMRDYFNQTIPVMHEVAGMIGDILKGIVHLGASDQDLVPLLKQIRGELFPAIGALMHAATGPLAHDMVRLFTDITRVLADLTSGGGIGFLTSFANALDQIARAIHDVLSIPFIGKLAGYLLGIAGAVAAYGKVIAILKGFSMVKWLTGMGTAARTTTAEMNALATAEERAAMAGRGGALGGFRGRLGRAGGLFAAGQIASGMIGGRTGSILGAAGTGAALGSFIGPGGTLVGGGIGALYGWMNQPSGIPKYTATSNSLLGKGGSLYTQGANLLGKGSLPMAGNQITGTTNASMKEQLANLAKTRAGYTELTTALGEWTAKARESRGAPKMLAQYMASSAQAALDAAHAYRSAGAAEHYMKSATNQLTTSLATHAAKVIQTGATYDSFRSQLNGLKEMVSQNGSALKGFSDGAIANRAALSGAAQAIFDHVNAMKQDHASAGAIRQSMLDMSQRLRDQAKAAGLSGDAVDNYLRKLGLMPGKIRRTLAGMKAAGLAAGGDLGRGFVLGIQRSQGAATSAAKILADQTVKHMREDALQERSPSKVTEKIGKFFVDGFAGGIMAGRGHAKRAAEAVAESALHAMYQSADKISSAIRSRRQSLSQSLGVLGENSGRTGLTSIRDAIQGGVHATNQEERALRRTLHSQVQSMQNTLHSTLNSLSSRAQTLRKEIDQAKSKKTQQKYITDLDKIEHQRAKVLDLRDALNRQEDRAQKYLSRLNDRLDRLATHRAKIAERLSKAQDRLAGLRDAKAAIMESVRTGISGFTDITGVVPQGVKITADRIVSGMGGRLNVVKEWAAAIRTLIKRGLNKTMIREIIEQGPDVGLQYARALLSATDAQIGTLNQTQKSITGISNNLAAYVGKQFYDVGINIAESLVRGLKKKQGDLDAVAAEMGRRMAKALKQALGIKSPSVVMRDEIGQFIPLGIAQGIDRATPHAVTAIHGMNRKLLAASQVAMTPALAQQAAGIVGPTSITGPLLAVEHLHVRGQEDIDAIEQMLYTAHRNVQRAAGQREVVTTS